MTAIVSWAALLLAVAALGYAWKLSHELATANRRLDRYNRALFDADEQFRRLREEMAESTARLRVDLMKRNGALEFAPHMTVREAQQLHPQVQQVLAGFHLGGCSSCAVEPDDSLAEICTAQGIELATLLANLNGLLAGANGNRGAEPQLMKIPNVTLEI